MCDYFSVNDKEKTAEGYCVLNRLSDEGEIRKKYHLTEEEFSLITEAAKKQMLEHRNKRKPPVTEQKDDYLMECTYDNGINRLC
ncbi:MAG: hypothetical protein R2847_03340 [Bacteroidia bacterium]